MATRVEKILANARLTLADVKKERWDDPTLIAILNEAQIDFCQQTQMLHERIDVPMTIGQAYFTLPEDCWMLTRALYTDSVLPLVTHKELDHLASSRGFSDFRVSCNWETDEGDPTAIIYDRRNMLEGKIYPIPNKAIIDYVYELENTVSETIVNIEAYGIITATEIDFAELQGVYGVASSVASLEDVELLQDYGVISTVAEAQDSDKSLGEFGVIVDLTDYTFNSPYGTLIDIVDSAVNDTIEDVYGFTSKMTESCTFLTCYYLQNPIDLVDATSDLSIPAMYDIALKFYLCGQAFMNDIDTGYQQKGAAQMTVYERHVATAKRDSSQDFTRAGQFQTMYRNF